MGSWQDEKRILRRGEVHSTQRDIMLASINTPSASYGNH